ncbi:MAG: rod shape-determining protein MreD [Fimbriimonas sp.]|nr:rod shape-determining protein MreD [Fimbriimonas sp.]
MKGAKGWIIAALLMWLAGSCQQSIAYQLAFAGSPPDFILVAIVTFSLFSDRRNGAVMGFIGGIVQGAASGGHMATYAFTRTILGFMVGWLTSLEFEGNAAVAFIVNAASTCAAQVAFLLLSPKGAIVPFLLATIVSAVYNGVLAIPLYALLKKVSGPPRH